MGCFGTPFFLTMQIAYSASTELDAINSILMSVGESSVNSTTVQSPEVVIARSTLQQVCREVQSEGWMFNTETEYPITLDTNNHCLVPNNVLQIDVNHFKHLNDFNVVRKKDSGIWKLYDLIEHRFNFENTSEGKLYVDVLWMVEFEAMPQVFRDYVTIRASRIASNRMINNPQSAELISQDESLARALAVEYDANQADYNIFIDQQYRTNPASVYRPYKVLNRR